MMCYFYGIPVVPASIFIILVLALVILWKDMRIDHLENMRRG